MQNGLTSATATVDYLNLLTIQLQNQDPIDPVDQEGLVNDLTQFSILEGIEGLNASFADLVSLQELSNGASIVGKVIQFQDPSSGELLEGPVDTVLKTGDGLSAIVGENAIPLNQILGVSVA